MTTEISRKGRQARQKKKIIKKINNHYISCTQEHTRLRSGHLVVTVVLVQGVKELEPTTHISVL